jgi:hypothetical protein
VGIFAGVKLDHRGAEAQGGFDLALIRADEQAHANAGVREARDDRLQAVVLPGGVESAFGGHFLALFGHDAGRVRLMGEGDREHLLGRGHLEVER